MGDLRAKGFPFRKIAMLLTQRGIRTKEGGAVWTHTAVARILKRQRKAA